MKKIIFCFSAFLILANCKTNQVLSNVKPTANISINSDISENTEIKNFINPYKIQLDDKMNKIISYTDENLSKSGNNSNLGMLLSDITKSSAEEWANKNADFKIDAAILNTGGIRSSISKGDIKIYHIFEVMPFDNELAIVKMSAEDVNEIFKYYLKYRKNNPVSGLEISIKNDQIEKALINGKAPQNGQYYYIATSDYLVGGGDNMAFFKNGKAIRTNLKLRDIFISEIKKMPKINVKKEIRLSFDKNNNE